MNISDMEQIAICLNKKPKWEERLALTCGLKFAQYLLYDFAGMMDLDIQYLTTTISKILCRLVKFLYSSSFLVK